MLSWTSAIICSQISLPPLPHSDGVGTVWPSFLRSVLRTPSTKSKSSGGSPLPGGGGEWHHRALPGPSHPAPLMTLWQTRPPRNTHTHAFQSPSLCPFRCISLHYSQPNPIYLSRTITTTPESFLIPSGVSSSFQGVAKAREPPSLPSGKAVSSRREGHPLSEFRGEH